MKIREIEVNEINKLLDCIMQLSEYHNTISVNFKGSYPSRPYNETLNVFSESLEKGQSRIAVIESGEKVIGFCKVDMNGKMESWIIWLSYRSIANKVLVDSLWSGQWTLFVKATSHASK